MICQVDITPEAEKDVFEITKIIRSKESLLAAKQVIGDLKKQFISLAETALSGRVGVCDRTREVVMTGLPFIVIFEKKATSLTVLRILHGAYERRLIKRE